MGTNLRARLQRIRESCNTDRTADKLPAIPAARAASVQAAAPLPGPDWVTVGPLVVKRSVVTAIPSPALPVKIPRSLGILVPDLLRYPASPPRLGDLLFFDLETTGLSTGPGTLAFLAAFGRLTENGLKVDQYLLLDYPGEAGFLEAVLGEFSPESLDIAQPLVISYNGKSFDSLLLKIRCLMNGIRPPEYFQADLLHPSRRLWKRVLPSCSQASIETGILGLDRSGDIPGSMAPDIWFSFLKHGDSPDLLKVCDHNARDIAGLSHLLAALCGIAEDPWGAGERFRCDSENLALRWRRAIRRHGEDAFGAGTAKTGETLLREAAEQGHRRAAYTYYRTRAVEAEWKRKDPEAALRYVDLFLALSEIRDTMGNEMFRRRERLLEKLKQGEGASYGNEE